MLCFTGFERGAYAWHGACSSYFEDSFARVQRIALMPEAATVDAKSTEPPARAAAPASKSNLKLIFIVGLVALLLGGGGVGVYSWLSHRTAAASSEETADAADTTADAKASKDGKKKGKSSLKAPAIYLALDPAFVVNFDAGGAVRFLQLTAQVMTRDAETAEKVKRNDPAIRNDLLLMFGTLKYEDVKTREGKETLRQQALEVVQKTISAEGGQGKKVEALLFTSFVMQ
jgi:flagellar protein FliL